MPNEEKEMTEHESLLIISQMIQAAKSEQKDNGVSWIIWGWMLFLTSLMTYFNMRFNWVRPYFFWDIFGYFTVATLVFAVVRTFFFKPREKVKTYTTELFKRLNIGFFITLVFIIVAMNVGVGPKIGFALLIGLYGFWILIYGTALNFRPSIIAAYVTWAIAYICLFVKSFDNVMLLHALAVFCGYLIPGHIAYSEFNKTTGRKQSNQKSVV